MRTLKIILLFYFLCTGISQASSYLETEQDSAKYKWIKGEKFLLHQVKAKETWSIIAKKYEIAISDLMDSNMGVADLKIGQILNVPAAPLPKSDNSKKQPEQKSETRYKTAILYTVHNSETLYGISKKFNTSVEDIRKWNNLEGDVLIEGQKLIVSYMYNYQKPEENPASTATRNTETITGGISNSDRKNSQPDIQVDPIKETRAKSSADYNSNSSITEKPQPSTQPASTAKSSDQTDNTIASTRSVITVGKKTAGGKVLMQVTESGICTWINDGDVSQSKYYALHRSAPVGTIVKVTNKMNFKSVFVKVVGVLPDTGDNEKSIVKISQTAVNKLGALDAHFQVELSYGMLQ